MKSTARLRLLFILTVLPLGVAQAQMVRPPAFAGGVPGMAQMQSVVMQRHQIRTLLYREALEELRKNPKAADVPECLPGVTDKNALCLRRPAAATPVAQPVPATLPETVVAKTSAPEPETKAQAAVEGKAPLATPAPQALAAVQAIPAAPSATPPAAVVAQTAPPQRRRLAVLVGNNGYTMPIPILETPIADVEKIAEVLRTRFGFETRVLHNATKAQIVQAVNLVADEVGPEDNVLLFYAGHGYLMDDTKMGFWIPVDASVKTAANWISNTDISKLLQAIRARQLILVSDSCFSGSLTREQKVSDLGVLKSDEIRRRRSVLVLSSGGDEPVSDEGKEGHSIFAWNLIKTLDASQGITSGYKVYSNVYGQVKKDAAQEPQYGAVVSAGHMSGGEYLFEVR